MTDKIPVNTKIDEPVKHLLKHIVTSITPEFPATKNMKLLIDAAIQIVIFDEWDAIVKIKDKKVQEEKLEKLNKKLANAITVLDSKNMIYDESRTKT